MAYVSDNKNLSLTIVLLSSILLCAVNAVACPVFMRAYQMPGFYISTPVHRRQLAAFTWKQKIGWQQQPIQINALDPAGNIDFKSIRHGPEHGLRLMDRLTFSKEIINGDYWSQKEKAPCDFIHSSQVMNNQRYLYLFVCKKKQPIFQSPIRFDEKQRIVASDAYQYLYDENNQLSFREITMQGKQSSSWEKIAFNAEQVILADVKRFFTLKFDASDVSAKLLKKVSGSTSLIGLLQFYLKILFFKIELSLTPEVQFYEDSLYMPMSLFSPVEAKEYINKGSGIFYSWQSPASVQWDIEGAEIPRFVKPKEFSQISKKFCNDKYCRFSLSGKTKQNKFELNFSIQKNIADLKFYPQLITDFSKINDAFDETITKSSQNRIGVFFETSQLPKGNHYWDFWIRFDDLKGQCPAKVKLTRRR